MIAGIHEISKRFGPVKALDKVSFEIRKGEVLGLIGPNGAGKTTLLECLAGLLPFEAGQVRIHGLAAMPGKRHPDLFYVPDGILPWPDQSLGSIARFLEDLFDLPRASFLALLENLGLGSLLKRPLGQFSKGERKRALLGIGLLAPHPLVLLDEPFDGLDPRQVRSASDRIRAHVEGGRTLLLSIHQLEDAARVCDRLVLLDAGRIVGIGSLGELRKQTCLPEASLEEIFFALT